jgi:hypothetical protein
MIEIFATIGVVFVFALAVVGLFTIIFRATQ